MCRPFLPALSLALLVACSGEAPPAAAPAHRSILTVVGDSASRIEGLAQYAGRLYVADWKDGALYRIDPAQPTPERVGALPTTPGQAILGLVADSAGDLYAAIPDPGLVYRVPADRLGAADFDPARDVTVFATGAVGANELAFDHNGHLWISGGDSGRLYHVGPAGGTAQIFAEGYSALSGDSTMPVRGYTVNGVGFDNQGHVYTVNTGTGEVSRLVVNPDYTVGHISTLAKDPLLLGADGLYVDPVNTLWIASNFRNALMRVTQEGEVTTIASSTVGADSVMAPDGSSAGEANVLRFPAQLERIGDTFYLANLNFPLGANAGQTFRGASVAAVRLAGAR